MIVTFYSYKGGLGRSMAVANIAVLLARDGYRVIIVDWDLEAPGIHRFFNLTDQDLAGSEIRGVIEYVTDFKAAFEIELQSGLNILPDLNKYLMPLAEKTKDDRFRGIWFMPAGRQDETYADRIHNFDWDNFYNYWQGGRAIEYLKQELLKRADYILVDSRTGLTDIGGICTKQLPNVLVLVVGSNWQSVDGVLDIIDSLRTLDNPPKVLPLPSRIDKQGERDMLQKWILHYPEKFSRSLPSEIGDQMSYFDKVTVPYQTAYSYGEELAVLIEKVYVPGTVGYAYQQLKSYIQKVGLRPRLTTAYRSMGALKVEWDVELAGNQIDMYVEMESADRGLHKIAVEVKDWDRPVGIDVINEFALVVENLRRAQLIHEGVIVSASGFSKQARNAAQTHGIRLLEPADLEKWAKLGVKSGFREESGIPTDWTDILERIRQDALRSDDIATLLKAIQDGRISIVTGERAVAVGGNAEDTLIVTGDGNVVYVLKGKDAEPLLRNVPYQQSLPKLLDSEFVDRQAELRRLKEPIGNPGAPRYVQVYAPSGLGKTYLLKKAWTEYKAIGWFCAWLDFSSDEKLRLQTSLILKQLGEQFGAKAEVDTCAGLAEQVRGAQKQSVIFLDAVDLASGEVRRWIKTYLIPSLEERIPDPKLRPYFIAASRYPIREWAVYSKQRFEFMPLTPFTDIAVDDLLRRSVQAAGYSLPDSFCQQTTEAILLITKGHPACIKKVLKEIRDRNFAILPQDITQANIFNRTVGTLLDEEILVLQVPAKLREVFKTLCVFRGYTPNLLDRLAKDGWVPAREHINWDLESELLTTHLIERPDSSPLYRLEPLIRQLVALQMEYNDKDRFWKLNEAALAMFEEQVKGKDKEGNELPTPPSDRTQVAFAVEALYHQAVLLRLDKVNRERAINELLDKIREYLSYRLTHESDDYWVNLLLGTIETDTELTALVYKLTGDGGLEFVLQPLYDLSKVQEV